MEEQKNICKVCENSRNNNFYYIREMMFGFKHEFEYFKCSKCGCLQIVKIPDNISDYYPSNYYSYNKIEDVSLKHRIAEFLLAHRVKYQMGKIDFIGGLAPFYSNYYTVALHWLRKKYCNYDSTILDIGCGCGDLLLKMHKYGFKYLKGVDPYNSNEINYFDKIKILKNDIYNITDQFDLVMLHHSFEHMQEPKKVFSKLKDLITDKGTIIIRIPIIDCYCWRKYGINWVALDAPRHYYLHTIQSIAYLADVSGLKINEIVYDSTDFQFVESEKYQKNIPLKTKQEFYSKREIAYYRKQAKVLNSLKDGDCACFFLKKINE